MFPKTLSFMWWWLVKLLLPLHNHFYYVHLPSWLVCGLEPTKEEQPIWLLPWVGYCLFLQLKMFLHKMIHLCPEMHVIRCSLNFVSATIFNITISICGGFFSGLGLFFFSLRSLQEGWARTLCNAYRNCSASRDRHLWTYCDTIWPSLFPADFASQPCKGAGRYSIPKNEHSLLQKPTLFLCHRSFKRFPKIQPS